MRIHSNAQITFSPTRAISLIMSIAKAAAGGDGKGLKATELNGSRFLVESVTKEQNPKTDPIIKRNRSLITV